MLLHTRFLARSYYRLRMSISRMTAELCLSCVYSKVNVWMVETYIRGYIRTGIGYLCVSLGYVAWFLVIRTCRFHRAKESCRRCIQHALCTHYDKPFSGKVFVLFCHCRQRRRFVLFILLLSCYAERETVMLSPLSRLAGKFYLLSIFAIY